VKYAAAAFLAALSALAQGLDPATLLKPGSSWPTYNGDYSGRRFSPLAQVNESNVSSLAVAWAFRTNTVPVKSTPLMVNGILYFTVPDHVWAVDARTGREIWHYRYTSSGGDHIGNRGVGMYKDSLYFETPDCFLVCLDARNGKQKWKVELGDVKLGYFSTMAPLVVRNHVIVGVSGDVTDVPDISIRAMPIPAPCNGDGTPRRSPVSRARKPGLPTATPSPTAAA